MVFVAAVLYTHFQYGPQQGDINLRANPGYNCDWTGKSCASDFIKTPKLQIFNGLYKRMKVNEQK